MQLADLLGVPGGGEVIGDGATDVISVAFDSRDIPPGSLFCCVPGAIVDGHDFAGDAVAAGAVALLVERRLDESVPQLVVPDVRSAMGPISSSVAGDPSRELDVVGVTGTNGKTTTTHLIRAVLEHAGRATSVIGTLTGARTTPEAPMLQAQLRAAVDEGKRAAAIEVSSHALDLHRVDGTWFRVSVFTNLSREHLDHHHTMEAYFRAKAALFEPALTQLALVNHHDAYGRLLLEAAAVPTRPYGLDDVENVDVSAASARFRWRGQDIALSMGGEFNVMNAVAAAEVGLELGVAAEVIAEGLSLASPVPGRFEPVDRGQPFAVVVDYAHTPDGLEQALTAARGLVAGGRVLVVFGAGGERDRDKRPLMGEVASRLSDAVYVTSDNPRSEPPEAIIRDILGGIAAPDDVTVEPDRRSAIAEALTEARAGDLVLIAGKGHETDQIVDGRSEHFDDREVAATLLETADRHRGTQT